MNSGSESAQGVAILFGGRSSEHDASCRSFEYLYSRLPFLSQADAHVTHIAYLTRDGGMCIGEYEASRPASYYRSHLPRVDLAEGLLFIQRASLFAFGILYGQTAEDGGLQGLLQVLGIPSSFGSVLPASLSMDKWQMAKYAISTCPSLKTPAGKLIGSVSELASALKDIDGSTIVIKPNGLGSSVLTERFSREQLPAARKLVAEILEYDTGALVQAYVDGSELSVGCLRQGGVSRALAAVRIETRSGFFGQKEKFLPGQAREVVIPVSAEPEEVREARRAALAIFDDLAFHNFARFDYINGPDGLYFLECNSVPGMLGGSLFTRMLQASGSDVEELIPITLQNSKLRARLRFDYTLRVEV